MKNIKNFMLKPVSSSPSGGLCNVPNGCDALWYSGYDDMMMNLLVMMFSRSFHSVVVMMSIVSLLI